MKLKNHIIAPALAFAASTLGADAAFTLIENFESYTTGGAIDQAGSGWVKAGTNNSTIVVDPAGGANKVGRMTSSAGQTNAFLPLGSSSIANNSTGTIFFRIQTNVASPNFNVGGSDIASPTSGDFNAFEAQLRLGGQLAGESGNLYSRGSGFVNIGSFSADTWLNIWLVVNNTTDMITYYSSTGTGAATQLGSTVAFRNGTTDSIQTFLSIAEAATGRAVFLDDIYVDTAGANTALPIPEPSGLLLGAIGALCLLPRKR